MGKTAAGRPRFRGLNLRLLPYATGTTFSARDLQLRDRARRLAVLIGNTPDGFFRLGHLGRGGRWSETRRSSPIETRVNGEAAAVFHTSYIIFTSRNHAYAVRTSPEAWRRLLHRRPRAYPGKPEADQVCLKAEDKSLAA